MKTVVTLTAACCLLAAGCSETMELMKPGGEPKEAVVFENYHRITLGATTAAEAIDAIHIPGSELLSQTRNVVASAGTRKRGHQFWADVAAFDEDGTAVARKYLLMVDERPKALFVEPWTSVVFMGQVTVDEATASAPYHDENARRLALIEYFKNSLLEDTKEIHADNKLLETARMMAKQNLGMVITRLKASPAEAARLTAPDGLEFTHSNLDKGRVKMILSDNIVNLEISAGMPVKKGPWTVTLAAR